MKTAQCLATYKKEFHAVRAALISIFLFTFAGVLSCFAQTAPVVFPWTMTTIAGNGTSGKPTGGVAATSAELSTDLRAVTVDGQGDVYFSDASNSLVGEINGTTGVLTIVAGGASTVCSVAVDTEGDGCPASQTTLNTPRGLALDKVGNLYIADYGNSMVRVVNRQTGIMSIVAGAAGVKTYTGDAGPANQATLDEPRGVRVDNDGNIWIADTGNNVIREINAATGIITTVVGSNPGTAGFAGDGSAANSSTVELHEPTDIVFDSSNNAYIADFDNSVIREVTASTGIISTIIGVNGGTVASTAPSFPAPALTTALGSPTKIAIDSAGNLYFVDSTESVAYFYDAVAKTITPIAGEYGYAGTVSSSFPVCSSSTDTLGDGCQATQATFYEGSSALGVAIDANNNLYITDPADSRIRKASTDLVFAVAVIGKSQPQTIEVHFSANDSPAATNGIVVGTSPGDFTVSGAPACTTNSDTTTTCTLQVTFDPVDPGLRTAPLAVTGVLSHRSFPLTGIGDGVLSSLDPGTASLVGSGLSAPHGAAMDAAGNLYIADTSNNRVVEIGATSQAQTIFAGTGTAGYSGDTGLATAATFSAPSAVTVSASGIVYIADTGNNVVRAVDPTTGNINTYAGGATTVCSIKTLQVDPEGDGCPATEATLKAPAGLTTDSFGNLYISDTGDNLIRRVDSMTGTINLDAGLITGATTCSAATDSPYGDGCSPTQAEFSGPTGLANDGNGNLFVADTGNNKIRMISEGNNLVTSVAGNGQSVFTGDGAAATSASLNGPTDVKVDAAGDLYIADTGNAVVRLVSGSSGDISTLLGVGSNAGPAGGSGSASQLQLSSPSGLAFTAAGNLFVSDTGNNRAIEDNRNIALLTFGFSNVAETTPEQAATINNTGNQALIFTDSPFYTASGDTGDFVLDSSAETACLGSETLKVGASCTLAASFDPTATGSFAETIAAPSNAVNQATANISLTGTGENVPTTTLSLVLTSPSSGSISYGESATFTATVAPSSGTTVPTGSVTFTVDGTEEPAVTLSSAGTAALTVSLTVGQHTIIAAYSGSTSVAPSNSTLQVTVSLAPTTTSLVVSPASQIQGQPVTLTAQVASATTGIPTGMIAFMSGTTALGTASLNAQGQATLTISSLAIASYSVTAVYSGDPNYATSTSQPTMLAITAIPPNFTATASPTTLTVPQGGTVQTILGLAPTGGISGTVTFGCTGLPANTTCTFYPTTVTLATPTSASTCSTMVMVVANSTQFPATDACTTLTIYSNVPPVALQSRLNPIATGRRLSILSAALFVPALLLFVPFTRKHKRLPWTLVAIAFVIGFAGLSGCASNPTQTPAKSTPVGTSTVTVTLTGPDGVVQSVPLTLNVIASTPLTSQLAVPSLARRSSRQAPVLEASNIDPVVPLR